MSRLSERRNGSPGRGIKQRAAEKSSCKVCHRPMKGWGSEGTCQSCLLLLPMPGMWDANEPPSEEEIAARLPRFDILEPLGRGALGTVYKATDGVLGRAVAIKLMKANPINPEFGARFLREAAVMAKLNHPNIVTVYDYGSEDDLHYLVMEWMEGGTLEDEGVGQRKLEPSRAFTIFDQICDALQYAHQQGVVHRDVKPSNILLDRNGNAKLSDFGLVKGMLHDEFREASLTRSNMSVGTPLYMAPEQMKGSAKVDHRADIYSAGAVLYEMLSSESAKDRSAKAASAKGVPTLVGAVIDRALDASPDARYERISEFKTNVSRRRSAVKNWTLSLAITAVGILLAALVWVIVSREMSARSEASRGYSENARKGLPLGRFDEVFDPAQWLSLADYRFENGWKEQEGNQIDLSSAGSAEVRDGRVELQTIDDGAAVVLSREDGSSLYGLALNLRFLVESYLGREEVSNPLFSLTLPSDEGAQLALKEPRWGAGIPAVFVGNGEPLAPPGVVAPVLTTKAWHELWLVLDEDHYRLWVNGDPVYHTRMARATELWTDFGEEEAELWVGGFTGVVDHVRVLEKR